MANARIELPNGTCIDVDGTAAEISGIIQTVSGATATKKSAPRARTAAKKPAARATTAGQKRRGRPPAQAVKTRAGNGKTRSIKKRRSPGRKGAAAIDRLLTDGYFANVHTLTEIRDELSKRGQAFKGSQLSPVLIRLSRNGVLNRKQHGKEWTYATGKKR